MTDFWLPPVLHNRRGELRKVGVELEFNGLSLPAAAQAVREAFGGTARQIHEYHQAVEVPGLGEFDVAFDSSLLRDKKYTEYFRKLGITLSDSGKAHVEAMLGGMGTSVVPLEVDTPPMPVDQIHRLARLEGQLRARRARGTGASVVYAFALHFNPEVPDPQDAGCLTRHLRAFLLLYHWLFHVCEIDWTRRLLPFIDHFPEDYARLVIDPGYRPDMAQLIDDYVYWNPTRNRPLDLLPVFLVNDPDLLSRHELKGQPVKGRPTFHYRLPNSLIDDPDWSIAREWNRWVLIERLADDADRLERYAEDYLGWEGGVIGYLKDKWFHHVEEDWIPDLTREPARTSPPA